MTAGLRPRPLTAEDAPAPPAAPPHPVTQPAPRAAEPRKPRVHATATAGAVPAWTRGRPIGRTDITVSRALTATAVTVDTGDCTYEIPLDQWICLARTTIRPRELWPEVR
jgi:hypothetical protein